ncbi:MAG TPA: hydrogenase iron-sulfur subunit [Methanomassiliicoccales archaeon]|nr:hydrogenase iron-sulfur subunit [Methanomassiliicoccales archaeon]
MSASRAADEKATGTIPEVGGQAFEPRIVAFLCNWCSYAGADLAGVSRLQYPPNVRIIRVMCSGRVSPMFVLRALKDGADGVLVSGCHPGDCHYLKGNLYTRRNLELLRSMMEYMGIEPDRFQMSWVSASEGGKFADVIRTTVEKVKKLGPNTKFQSKIKREGGE